jgi:hypothetical protein
MPGGRRAGPGRPGPGSVSCPGCVLTVSFGERGRVPGKAPGNAHQRVAVLGQSLPRYPAPAVHRGRLVERWGEAGGGVQVRGIGVSVDECFVAVRNLDGRQLRLAYRRRLHDRQ